MSRLFCYILHWNILVQKLFFSELELFSFLFFLSEVPIEQPVKFFLCRHHMQTGRWLSKLSAVWDPKHQECFVIGSVDKPRRIQVYHESGRLLHTFRNMDHLTTVCSITAFHPRRNTLLGGNSSGRLHIFTDCFIN